MSLALLPLLTQQTLMAVKAETTIGTAESLTGTEAALNFFDSKMEPQGDINRRRGQSSLSPLPGVPGISWNKFSGKSELYGGGSADPPYWAVLLQACGMSLATATLTPQTGSATATTVTIGNYEDGKLYRGAGGMGNFTLAAKAGEVPVFSWDFMLTYIPPTDTALLTPTYPTVIPPPFMASTFTMGGTAYNVSEFELSPNNKVQTRKVGNSATYGVLGAFISDRRWTLKVTLEDELVATEDWNGMYIAGTTAAFNSVFGGTTHNTTTIAAPKLQLAKQPGKTDIEGARGVTLEFDCIRNAAGGDDEVSILFA